MALRLLKNNYKQINCLTEAAVFTINTQLRSLFITILLYSPIAEPVILQDHFKQSIYNNLFYFLAYQLNTPLIVTKDNNAYFNYSLYLIYQIFADHQKILINYSLPQFQYQQGFIIEGNNLFFIAKLQQYNPIKEKHQFTELHQQLNIDQVVYFNTIVAAIDTNLQAAYFFFQGLVSTGKTFLYYCLCYYYCLYSKIVLYITFTGIVALLLPSSCTAHSRFWIPINLYKEFTYNISKNLNLAKLLYYTSLLIQDKVLIQHYYYFKAVHCILIDIRSNDFTFSRLPTILGGDFA